jgi:hypothetical protein
METKSNPYRSDNFYLAKQIIDMKMIAGLMFKLWPCAGLCGLNVNPATGRAHRPKLIAEIGSSRPGLHRL